MPKMPKIEVSYRFYKKKKAKYFTILTYWFLVFHAENTRRYKKRPSEATPQF